MAYIGRPPEYGGYEHQVLTADGSTTSFALNYSVGTESSLLVSVAGVFQQPSTAYTLSGGGANIVFSAAPANGATVFVIFLGFTYDAGNVVNTGSITGQTDLGTSPASTDFFLLYDDSASALKKVAYSDVHTGVANMAANTVKVRDAASTGAPSDKAVADTQILIGDGTGFTAAALSGGATMANTGAVTIAAGIDATKIADGSVTSTEFQYINSLSSNAQTQISGKAVLTGSTNNMIPTVTGANAITGEANFTYDGNVLDIKNAGTASSIKLYCESSNAHYQEIKAAPHSGSASWTLTLPGTDGNADEFLKTNGSGVTSWAEVSGGTSWQAIVTGATTMVAGNGYFVNTTGSAFSMTLPSSASLGDEIHIIDYAGTFDTNNCTVARNSHKIQGATSDLVVATERAAFKLVYVDATQGWLLTEL